MDIARLVLEYVRALVWPLTVFALSVSYRSEIKSVLGRLKKVVLPGDVSLDLQEEVHKVQQLSEKVESTPQPDDRKKTPGIPLTEANARMIELGLRPSPSGLDLSYYDTVAESDPILALAGLRIELETMTRNLATGFKIETKPYDSIYRLLSRLREAGAITPDQMKLAKRVLGLCNQAIHGKAVSREQAIDVINAASVLAKDFLAWLGWGFDDNWKPSKSP